MTNIEKIMFDAKYSVKFMNGLFVISGFNHTKSLQIPDNEFCGFINNDNDLVYFDEDDWNKLVDKIQKEKRCQ